MKIPTLLSMAVVMGLVGAENAVTLTPTPTTNSSALPSSSTASQGPVTSSSTPAATSSNPSSSTTSSTPDPTSQPTTTVAPTSPATSPEPPVSTTPKPKPKEFFWNVTGNNVTCILAKADITLSLTYIHESSKKEIKVDMSVPHDAISSGQCGLSSQNLTLSFGNGSISFNFTENKGTYHVAQIMSTITVVVNGTNTTELYLASGDLNVYDTHLNTSYGCSWSEPATLQEEDGQRNTTLATMRVTLKHMRFEAFRNSKEDAFSEEYLCPVDSPDIVPVMVGIALGILVAVVLIAYLVGRRSTQAQGYLSM